MGKVIAFLVPVIALVAVGPVITIWALNTLFGLMIPTTLATWAATFWLTFLVAAKVSTNNK